MKYFAPSSFLKAFTCPHCGVLASQSHYSKMANLEYTNPDKNSNPIRVSQCQNCEKICLWYFDKMVYPNRGSAPMPNEDMPENAKLDYEEAASLYSLSPRGAAALLRLSIQKICVSLGGQGKNINDDIACLVKNGLPITIQKALDVVRVVGNNAVHPGQIDVDNPDDVEKLFALLNLIVEYMISMPKKVNDLYISLPVGSLQAIKKRDKT